LCVSFVGKELNAKDILKVMFPVCGGKCLSRKALHDWVEIFSQGRSKVVDDTLPSAEVAESAVKGLLFRWFQRIGKAMGQVYQCW
jgi:hypothetical protein